MMYEKFTLLIDAVRNGLMTDEQLEFVVELLEEQRDIEVAVEALLEDQV
jgi:hypothetical protein